MRALAILAFLAAVLAMTASADASILIAQANNSTPVPQGSATLDYNPKTGGWNIHLLQLYNQWGDTVYNIIASGGEVIDNVYIDVNGPPAGSPVIVRLYSAPPNGLHTVHNIIQTGSAETLLNVVYAGYDIGAVQVEAVGDLHAGRDVIGPIIATTSDNFDRGVTTIQAGRHILGSVTAENGRIVLVWAQDGNIGSPDNPVTIRAKHRVMHIMANEVYADINTRVNGGAGGLWALVTDKFQGIVDTEKLIFNPYNSIEGFVRITQQFGGAIRLGKSFNTPGQFIELPVAGLTGQIVINADNSPGGAWTSPIRLGPDGHPQQIILNGPNYTYTPEQLGGGSIGLVPFHLREQFCSPANGETALIQPDLEQLVVSLRHEGPITWLEGAPPVTIERRPAGSQAAFVPLNNDYFEFVRAEDDPSVLTIGPAKPDSGFLVNYEYRIRRTPHLRCDVASQPQVVWDHDYVITVLPPPCDGDVNASYAVNIDDLFIVIAFWGQSPSVFPGADVTQDGLINIDDLFVIIGAWGPCW